MNGSEHSSAPTVRVALGWRARDVERESTAHVIFADQDESTVILENDPAALVYADPQHAFVLPAGRFVRVDQVAGRVYAASATPHLDALTPAAATTLADSVSRLLEHAGWQRATGVLGSAGPGLGTVAAVAAAVRYGSDGQGGAGVSHVGTWRVPRSGAPWAALPAGTQQSPEFWDGGEAVLTLMPTNTRSTPANVRLILQVRVADVVLAGGLSNELEARRARLGGAMQSLRSWDAQPTERLPPLSGAR